MALILKCQCGRQLSPSEPPHYVGELLYGECCKKQPIITLTSDNDGGTVKVSALEDMLQIAQRMLSKWVYYKPGNYLIGQKAGYHQFWNQSSVYTVDPNSVIVQIAPTLDFYEIIRCDAFKPNPKYHTFDEGIDRLRLEKMLTNYSQYLGVK